MHAENLVTYIHGLDKIFKTYLFDHPLSIFEQDKGITDAEWIPAELVEYHITDQALESSPWYILQGTHLGIVPRFLPHVYQYTVQEWNRLVKGSFRHLDQQQERLKTDGEYADAVHACLLRWVLVNPDHTTAWNGRRYLLKLNVIPWEKEWAWTTLLLSLYPKKATLWSYRYQLIHPRLHPDLQQTYDYEISACEKAAMAHPHNYHAWSHRRRVLEWIPTSMSQDKQRAWKWVQSHVSDGSGWNYYGWILSQVWQPSDAVMEMKRIQDCILFYPGHESMWMHVRRLYSIARLEFPIVSEPRSEQESQWARRCSDWIEREKDKADN